MPKKGLKVTINDAQETRIVGSSPKADKPDDALPPRKGGK